MEIVLIAAVDINLAIGKDGTIPWDIKEDLKFFKEKLGGQTLPSLERPRSWKEELPSTGC